MRAKVHDDCDEAICAGWGEPGGEWIEWGWRNVLFIVTVDAK